MSAATARHRVALPARLGRAPAAAFLLLVTMLPAPGLAGRREAPAGLDGNEILRRAEEIRSPETDYAVEFTLRVVDETTFWKERNARYSMIAHGKDYSLVVMREPKQFYPGTLLIARSLYWLLLPKAEKPFQLSAQHVLEGDISNGDLARGNLVRNYNARLDGEESVDGARCWRLEMTLSGYEGNYPRIRSWVERKSFRPRKFEYYGKTGQLLKTALYDDYRKGPLGVKPMRIEVTTPGRPNETTTLVFSDLRPLDASGLKFTTDGLLALRDAAREKIGADGAQISLEDLVALLGRTGT